MSNRAQRRSTNKLKSDPKVKAYVEKFAMDLSKLYVNHFERVAASVERGEAPPDNLDEYTKGLFVEKGVELKRFIEDFAEDTKNNLGKEAIRVNNLNKLKVNIK